MATLEILAQGIERVNLAYIERADFNRDDYLIMLCAYLVTMLLPGGEIGFYSNPVEVGFTGWLSLESKTLFFGPTKAIVLDNENCPRMDDGALSPYGEL